MLYDALNRQRIARIKAANSDGMSMVDQTVKVQFHEAKRLLLIESGHTKLPPDEKSFDTPTLHVYRVE